MAGSGSQPKARRAADPQPNGFAVSFTRFWKRSYASDYLGLVLLLTAYILIQFLMEPFHRMFSLDNIAIQYPYALIERVPASRLFVYAGGLPLITLVLWAVIWRPGVHKAHVSVLGLIISLVLTSFITDIIKNAVGRPRPDLIARCKPQKGTSEHGLVTFEVCTESDHHTLHDGWRSFPSGHSSFAFSGLGYLALFLAAFAPLLGAALIAISRCEDYRHDVYDVTIGSLLGFFIALFTYRRYYPPLRSAKCDTPYPNRAQSGVERLKDEEQRIQSAGEFELDDFGDEAENVPLTNTHEQY